MGMKFKVLVEYEYPTEHKLPVKAELVLHGDRVVTDDIKWIEQEPTTKNDLGVDCISRKALLDELEKWDWQELYLPIHFGYLNFCVFRGKS